MPVDVAAVVEGCEMPPFPREANFHSFNRYAVVNDDLDVWTGSQRSERATPGTAAVAFTRPAPAMGHHR
ncbi:hypothetical protein [Frankia gtarii]|uniref:hypothetical protein n=1 Tax=Frankia gtarii TaxID=2950102 RepID=UPI0021BEC92A|nr:hypothetical protein [Frankia gtarii]